MKASIPIYRTARRAICRSLLLVSATAVPVWAQPEYSTPYYISTLAGAASVSSKGSNDGPGRAARFNGPHAVALGPNGDVFVADNWNRTIRKITPEGVVSTFAGTAGVYGSTDGPSGVALFGNPRGVATDAFGNVYVADSWANTIRKITPEGIVTTFAGAAFTEGSSDGTGREARFRGPEGIAVDAAGMVYVVDSGNKTIRKITPSGVVTTLAGTPGLPGWNPLDGPMPDLDGMGSAARFISLGAIAVDGAGNLYVTDGGTIRKITPAGMVTTFAGKAGSSNWGSTDGLGSEARFTGPEGVAVDLAGNVYVADSWNNTIRKITPGAMVSTLAGLAAGYPPDEFSTNSTDGVGSVARFNYPLGLTVDATGTIYVADTNNNTIRKITPAASVTTLAGISPFQSVGSDDGPGSVARFASPHGTAVDTAGNVYVADSFNHTIRKISANGLVTTLAGTAGESGATDAPGRNARFYFPKGVAVDATGTLYVADTGNATIRKITPTGVVTTLAGLAGTSGSSDGTGPVARFLGPEGVAVDRAGTVYVADTDNDTIRKITSAGVVTTLAGLAGISGSANGTGNAARFFSPEGVAVDSSGTVYVADSGNFTIRRITAAGAVTTLAGAAGNSAWVDGAGDAARFYGPEAVAVDGTGTLFVTDNANYKISKYIKGGMAMIADGGSYTIRKITPAGLVSSMATPPTGAADAAENGASPDLPRISAAEAGDPSYKVSTVAGQNQGDADGVGKSAQFDLPRGIAADAVGTVYVSCSNLYSNTIRKGQRAGPPIISTQPQSQSVVTGGSLQLSVTAGGAPPPAYQWYFNGSPFSGATTPTLSIVNARSSDAGEYTVVVTNELGSVTSVPATLTISAATNPTPAPGGSGGGGSIEQWFALLLAALAILRLDWFQRTASAGCLIIALTAAAQTPAPSYYWTTLAGRASIGQDDGSRATARFNQPTGLAYDSAGYLYIADSGNHTIRKLSPDGIVTTLAGSPGQPGSTDGTGAAARFNGPQGVAVDATGNVYVADTGNYTIRKVTPTGVVTTLAGQAGQQGTADGSVASAFFYSPKTIAVDGSGAVYVYDAAIRRIAGGVVQTILASGMVTPIGSSKPVMLFAPNCPAFAVDANRRIYFVGYVMDGFPYISIYKMDSSGGISVVAGNRMLRSSGPSTAHLALDPTGNLLEIGQADRIKGWKYEVLKINPDGKVVVGEIRNDTTGAYDFARGLAVSPTGEITYSRSDNVIAKMAANGTQTLLAGQPGGSLTPPSSLAIDTVGNVWAGTEEFRCFGDLYESYDTAMAAPRVLMVARDGNTTIPFKPDIEYGIWGHGPAWVAIDTSDSVNFAYIDRTGANLLRRITANGSGSESVLKQFVGPFVMDGSGNLIVPRGNVVWKRTPDDTWSILAGNPDEYGTVDGVGGSARFGTIGSLTADRSGNFYCLDTSEIKGTYETARVIRRISPGGVVSTVSSNLQQIPALENAGGFAADSHGSFYFTANCAVVRFTADGAISVIGGVPLVSGSADGLGKAALFSSLRTIQVDAQDNLYVSDYGGGNATWTIRKGQLAGPPMITAQPQSLSVTPGSSAQFSVTVSGAPPPTYQWYFNGSPFSGATTNTLSFANARSSDAGQYAVVVTNELGSVTSATATLTVSAATNPVPAPPGGGGGGAVEGWFAAALAGLGLVRRGWVRLDQSSRRRNRPGRRAGEVR